MKKFFLLTVFIPILLWNDIIIMTEELQIIGLQQIFRIIPSSDGIRLGEDFMLIDVANGENLGFMNYPFRADAYFFVFCRDGA